MKVRLAWYLGAIVVIGLGIAVLACSMIEPSPPASPLATIAPPAVPHAIEGRADCRMCHEAGIGGAPKFPANHAERPSDVCLTCHESAVAALPTMPTPPAETVPAKVISAEELYNTKCAACHGADRQGVPGLAPALTPESLANLTSDEVRYIISDGRTGTAMPPFKATLSPEEIDALLQLIKETKP